MGLKLTPIEIIHPIHPSRAAQERLNAAAEVLVSHACLSMEMMMGEDMDPCGVGIDDTSLFSLHARLADDLRTLIGQAELPRS